MYPPRLIDHFQNPRNVGELEPPAVMVEVSNPACGDILRLSARFEADVAVEVRYKVRGCTASIAAGSALTEWMEGKTRARMAEFEAGIVDQAVGGFGGRIPARGRALRRGGEAAIGAGPPPLGAGARVAGPGLTSDARHAGICGRPLRARSA